MNDKKYGLATTYSDGLMSAADKSKLDNLTPGGGGVTGVKGNAESAYRTGNVNLTKSNIGLGNVDNTSDVNKPVSTATQTALNGKANASDVPFAFGIDDDGNYGYIKNGETEVTPFASGSPLPPGGEVIIRKLSSETVGFRVDLFSKHENTIVGIGYGSKTYCYSTDNGSTWTVKNTSLAIGGIDYSESKGKFYVIQDYTEYASAVSTRYLSFGVIDNSFNVAWSVLYSGSCKRLYGNYVKASGDHVYFGFLVNTNTTSYNYYCNGTYYIYDELQNVVSQAAISTCYDRNLRYKNTVGIFLTTSSSSGNYTNSVINQNGARQFPEYNSDYIAGVNNDVAFSNKYSSGSGTNTQYRQHFSRDPGSSWAKYGRPEGGISSSEANNYPLLKGYFEIGTLVYAYSDTMIARAYSLTDVCNYSVDKYSSLSDIGTITSVVNISDKKVVLASNGSVYLCEIT